MLVVETRDLAGGVEAGYRCLVVFSTRPSVSTFSPPKVNLSCAVIGNPENGASTTGFAQFDFGGVIPEVALPSIQVGSQSPGPQAALNSLTVTSSFAGSRPSFSARPPIVSDCSGGRAAVS